MQGDCDGQLLMMVWSRVCRSDKWGAVICEGEIFVGYLESLFIHFFRYPNPITTFRLGKGLGIIIPPYGIPDINGGISASRLITP